jgi:single-strand DNA-binding protein
MFNEVTLPGRIGKKDAYQLKNGGEMINLSLATSRTWTDQQGNKQEKTTWHNINCFNKLGDIAKRYAHVGNPLFVKGEVNHKKITHGDREGEMSYSVTATHITLLPGASKKSGKEDSEKAEPETIQEEEFDDSEVPF